MTDADLSEFGRALKELLLHIGAVQSIPVKPSTSDLMDDIEKAIIKLIEERRI